MVNQTLERRMLDILEGLSETGLQCQSRQDALHQIVEIGQAAMGSDLFSLALIDFERYELHHADCKSQIPGLKELIIQGLCNISLNQPDRWILNPV